MSVKVNNDRSKFGLQQGALAHTEQKAIKDPTITIVKQLKQEKPTI